MRKTIARYFERLLAILRVRPVAAGLDVSDQIIRLAYFDGKLWQMHAIRLAPGVVENGKIKDKDAFAASLMALKLQSKISQGDRKKRVAATVSLSSAPAYSQVFALPFLEGKELEKAIALNLQMASPGTAAELYSGWQIVGRDEKTLKISVLGFFLDRVVVDDMVASLFSAGFLALAVESRSLALARVLREKGSGIESGASYLLVDVDNVGIDFLVIRNSQLHFEYANPWRDVAGEKGEITGEQFQATLAASLRQVVNFYNQHWTEPITVVVISASAFGGEIESAVTKNLGMPAVRLELLMGQPISPEWLVALGCSLRMAVVRGGEQEINLLGAAWEDRFRDEQILNFLDFWDVAVPATLGAVLLIFALASLFLGRSAAAVKSNVGLSAAAETPAVLQLSASAQNFNNLVAMVKAAESVSPAASVVAGKVQAAAASSGVAVSRLSFPGAGSTISVSGIAKSEDGITAFKNTLADDPNVSSVDLPLSGIQPNGGGSLAFTMSFVYHE